MIRYLHILLRHIALVALVIALPALPFVHRAGAEPVTPDISQFISMGGKLSDICGEFGGHKAGGCESCNITAALLRPACVQLVRPVSTTSPFQVSTSGQTDEHQPAPNTIPPVRAPPHA